MPCAFWKYSIGLLFLRMEVKARTWAQMSPSIAFFLTFFFWARVSHWTYSLPIQLDCCPTSPRESPIPASPALWLEVHDITTSFFQSVGDQMQALVFVFQALSHLCYLLILSKVHLYETQSQVRQSLHGIKHLGAKIRWVMRDWEAAFHILALMNLNPHKIFKFKKKST